ncbi:24173_t:CDS:1, partial [Cetraspora pellucida]
HLKSSINVDTFSKIPWDDEISDESSKTVSFAETIAAKFDIKHLKNKNLLMITPPVINLIAEPFIQANPDREPSTINQYATNFFLTAESHKRIDSNKKSSVIKVPKTKLSSAKPYTQTRNQCKLTDLAKDMLINLNASEQSPSVYSNHQNLT